MKYLMHITFLNLQSFEEVFCFLRKEFLLKVYPIVED